MELGSQYSFVFIFPNGKWGIGWRKCRNSYNLVINIICIKDCLARFEEQKAIQNKRYSASILEPGKVGLLDRMVVDSRQIVVE